MLRLRYQRGGRRLYSKDNSILDDADLETLYSLLKSPIEKSVIRSPGTSKLNPEYIKSLPFNGSPSVSNSPKADASLNTFVVDKDTRADAIVHVLHLFGRMKVPDKAYSVYEQAVTNGIDITLPMINALLDSYAEVGDLSKASSLFKELPARKLKPDLITYGTLIKAAVNADDLRAAFQIYETMKDKKVHPSLRIYTSLIQGCIKAKDIPRAWKTFDYMRREICDADTNLYSLMIHACSTTRECERALDLFEEMAKRGVPATAVTYNSLIQACGSRSDYYLESWDLYQQMQANGFLPTKRTFNVLLWNAARNGDFEKCDLVWTSILEKWDTDKEYQPDAFTFMAMFHGISKKMKSLRSVSKQQTSSQDLQESHAATSPPRLEHNLGAPQIVPMSSSNVESLVANTEALWSQVSQHLLADNSLLMAPKLKSELFDHYLSVYSAARNNPKLSERALAIFNTLYDSYNVAKSGRSHTLILGVAARESAFMLTHGQELWKQYLQWEIQQETFLKQDKGYLTADELEIERSKSYRGKRFAFSNFLLMINGLARVNNIQEALDIVDSATRFRDPFYLPPIHFAHIPSLVVKVRDLATNGQLDHAERLRVLCSPPSDNPVEEVSRVLKKKWIGSDWWGWEALGVEENTRRKMIRERKKESLRVKQYFESRRMKKN
ncbi:hypothetical protein HDU97_010312 [Phlyctochytrium planicorne]|nr:hypothetical protein HDU97_010312 [Phlyctochytrium planicorne]